MKKQILMIMLAILLMVNLVQSELYLWNSVTKDTSKSTVRYTASYWVDDTSASGVGRYKSVNIVLWSEVEQLPFNFSGAYPVSVDWCNYTIVHESNLYDVDFIAFQGLVGGGLINTSIETFNYYFENSSFNSTQKTFRLKNKDTMRVNMECHYTDVNYLYVENILVGRFFTYVPSFECDNCEQYTLEEITHQVDVQDNLTRNELGVYTALQNIIEWNWTFWLIAGWFIRFAFLMIALMLIFSGVYYFYKFLKNLSQEM